MNPIFFYVSPEIVIFHEPLIVEIHNNLQHWIWHALNPKYAPIKPFWCMFPSRNQQNVKFLPELWFNSPWQNNWTNVNLHREKAFAKAVALGFGYAWDKYFLSDYGFLHFWWEGQDIGFNAFYRGTMGPKVELLHTSHPMFMVKFSSMCPEIVIFHEPLIVEIHNKCSIGFGMPWTLNMHHSSHFDACFPVEINSM